MRILQPVAENSTSKLLYCDWCSPKKPAEKKDALINPFLGSDPVAEPLATVIQEPKEKETRALSPDQCVPAQQTWEEPKVGQADQQEENVKSEADGRVADVDEQTPASPSLVRQNGSLFKRRCAAWHDDLPPGHCC